MRPKDPAAPVPVPAFYDADLAWLDRLLEREILRLRAHYELSLDELRGLYISDRQVDELLRQHVSDGPESPGPVECLSAEAARLRALRRGDTPLAHLARRFGLTVVETDLLLLALTPELSLKYETLYAYLNNDITRKHLTVDLALRVLDHGAEPMHVRLALRPGGPLFTRGLLDWIDAGSERRSLRAQGFTLAPPTAQFLLGLPVEDQRLPSGVRVVPPAGAEAECKMLGPEMCDLVYTFTAHHPVAPGLFVCIGDSVPEQLVTARLYAARHGHSILTLPLAAAISDPAGWPVFRTRLCLLASLAPAVVVLFDEGDCFPREPQALAHYTRIVRELSASGLSLFLAVPREAPWAMAVGEISFVELALPEPSAQERAAAWCRALARFGLPAGEDVSEELGERFVLPRPRIFAAAQTAALLCIDTGTGEDALHSALWHAAHRHSSQALSQLASLVVKPHRWEHLVLPEATLRQVREVASAIRQRERVFRRWRMAERTGRGNGLMALFAGASGTGKTMTAAVIANGLGLELYRIDLANVVSKYIGETEKNLDRIFEAARRSNGILFFDEADALLGKRSEVKDAHDRYANIEVAYLLQKMEEHEGVVILASNLPKNLDQAFARRMHYVVDFPRPDTALRERLWQGMFPPEAPLAEDIDFRFLAEQFETSGGEIQTIALDAAFLASAEDNVISMPHLVQAMARHQLKQGNPAGMSGFKQYYGMVRAG